MSTKPDYTREDWYTWLAHHPCDADWERIVVGTFGFQMFVIGRRMAEATDNILTSLEPPVRHLLEAHLAASNRLTKWWTARKLERYLRKEGN